MYPTYILYMTILPYVERPPTLFTPKVKTLLQTILKSPLKN